MALFTEFLLEQWILAAALLVAVGMLVFHEMRKAGPALTPQEAINLVNAEDGVFVDLRDSGEYKQGHIADALHIPMVKLEARQDELKAYRERPVILVCKMGQQAGAAAKQLRAGGYGKVYKMAGGMLEWRNLQLPVVTRG
jgi:rhodanese-related sulfurtransferase